MSTTHNLPYTRFTRQVSTDPMALLSTNVAAAAAAQLLQTAPWIEQSEQTPTFPPRAAMLTAGTPSPAFDAYKYVGDYADGKQVAYAGAVAYRFKVPAAALTGPTEITSIALPIYVDRWLVDGIRVAAYLSDSTAPPSAWATIRAGDVNDDAVLPMTYTDPGGARIVVEKNGTTTLTWPALTDSKKYVYVMLTLEDYESVRGFWIEGASLIRGAAAVTTFAASVAADPADASGDFAKQLFTRPHVDASGSETVYQYGNSAYAAIDLPSVTDTDLLWLTAYARSTLRRSQSPLYKATKTAISAQIRNTDDSGVWRLVSIPDDVSFSSPVAVSKEFGLVFFSEKLWTNNAFGDIYDTMDEGQGSQLTSVWPATSSSMGGASLTGYYTYDMPFDKRIYDTIATWPAKPTSRATASSERYVARYDANNYAIAFADDRGGSGVMVTTDAGANWTEKLYFADLSYVVKGVCYFGSASKIAIVTIGGEVRLSVNGGVDWSVSKEGTTEVAYYPSEGYGAFFSPADDTIVLGLHTLNTVYMTSNGGTTWATLRDNVINGKCADLAGGKLAVIDSDQHLAITSDAGATWERHPLPFDNAYPQIGSHVDGGVFVLSKNGSNAGVYVSDDVTSQRSEIQMHQSLILFAGGVTGDISGQTILFDSAFPAIPAWMTVDLRVYARAGHITASEVADTAYGTNPAEWYAGQDVGSFKHLASVRAHEGMDQMTIDVSKLSLGYHTIIVTAHIANIVAKPDPFVTGTWYGIEWSPNLLKL